MGELARNQIADGDQMAGGAIAACFGLGRLDEGIAAFDATVGEPGIEGIEDALPVVLQTQGDLFDGFDPAAPRPGIPLVKQGRGRLPVRCVVQDVA